MTTNDKIINNDLIDNLISPFIDGVMNVWTEIRQITRQAWAGGKLVAVMIAECACGYIRLGEGGSIVVDGSIASRHVDTAREGVRGHQEQEFRAFEPAKHGCATPLRHLGAGRGCMYMSVDGL